MASNKIVFAAKKVGPNLDLLERCFERSRGTPLSQQYGCPPQSLISPEWPHLTPIPVLSVVAVVRVDVWLVVCVVVVVAEDDGLVVCVVVVGLVVCVVVVGSSSALLS